MHRPAVQQRRALPTSPFQRNEITPASTDDYRVGNRVTHDRFGMGRVVAVDTEYITIDFGEAPVRRLRAGARGLSRL